MTVQTKDATTSAPATSVRTAAKSAVSRGLRAGLRGMDFGTASAAVKPGDDAKFKGPYKHYSVTKDCGVVDTGHLNPAYARSLIDSVRTANSNMSSSSPQPSDLSTPAMASLGNIKLNKTSLKARLKKKLSDAEVLGVSLYLFQQTSVEFEAQQGGGLSIGGSSYSGEDLPSNLLSFYRAAFNLPAEQVMAACGEAVPERTDSKPQVGQNETFRPVGLPEDQAFPPASLGRLQPIAPGDLYEIVATEKGWAGFDYTPADISGSLSKTYVVKPGDTLWKIAVDHLGSGARWEEIQRRNNIANPGALRPGMILEIPRTT